MASSSATSRPSILVAEGQPELREVLRHLLRDSYEVTFAGDGVEAVRAILRTPPDVLLLDLHLARLDGLMALEVVRAASGDLPVVLTSCVADSTLRSAAERLGVSAVLRKPFSNADLLAALARELARAGRFAPRD
ncbi:MAG TPA: response regulator [Methylomirabilota bacterium]|jgi:CheY-like chemotaxis protein|nr:response regulator [Methylomirabilota bacterium]